MPQLVLLLAEASLGAKVLAGVLWTGLGGLTIALVVLMRTRWGQAKPLSKCVALSLYAHVLLMTYAYSTKLVLPTPQGHPDGVIDGVQLHLLDTSGDSADLAAASDGGEVVPQSPWESFPVETPPEISLAAPAKQDVAAAPDETLMLLEQQSAPDMASMSEAPIGLPTPEIPDIPLPGPVAALPVIAAAAIDLPKLSARELIAETAPQPAAPDRMTTAVEMPGTVAPAVDPSAPLQELTEIIAATTAADALASGRDVLNASPNELDKTALASTGSSAEIPPLQWINRELIKRPPRRLADGEPVPELYRMRVAPDRRRIARRLGATKESDKAVDKALAWLGANQSDDGRWSAKQFGAGEERKVLGQDRQGAGADADTGITGLALLSMFGAGHTHLEGPYRQNVQRGLEYLVSQQKEDGNLSGDAKLYAMMYCHGMASLALSEAYAMTGDQRLQPYVEKAGGFSLRSQHSTTGGWRYLPGDPGDMSQFGWQVMALKSAELAGVAIPDKNRSGMLRFLHNNTSGRFHGLGCYRTGERPSRTMTAEAFACRVFLGLDNAAELSDEAAKFILEDLPQDGKADFYYWYYGSLAMFQLQDERWKIWNDALQKQLINRQKTGSELAGSFDTDEVWSGYGGRVYTTAMAALCLEVYYRYLPIYSEHE